MAEKYPIVYNFKFSLFFQKLWEDKPEMNTKKSQQVGTGRWRVGNRKERNGRQTFLNRTFDTQF